MSMIGCGWCLRMQVIFAAVAARVPDSLFFRIDCREEATSCPDITEFPTIKLYPADESDEVPSCILHEKILMSPQEFMFAGDSVHKEVEDFVTSYRTYVYHL